MELIVAEKPKVAEKIAHAIGDDVEKKVYKKISYYEVKTADGDCYVAPAVGHVYTLVEKQKSSGYPTFDIEWVPAYEANPKKAAYTKEYVELLQKLARSSDVFVSACDYDVEGSTIAYNVFRFATTMRDGKRMKFSALTPEDLKSAYEKRAEFDYNNAYAGEARHMLDWYYGINLSRALMSSLRSAARYKVLSIGRVQGPALSILTGLEKEIRAFISTPYWELTTKITDVDFQNVKGRFTSEDEASLALKNTDDDGKVSLVEKKEQKIVAPPNFDLTSLQVEAYRLFKYDPSRVLEIAQNLYEASMITYPRTSSQKIPPSINLPPILAAIGKNPTYSDFVKKITKNSWYSPVQGKKEDPAHPAIHPTGQAGKLDGPDKNVYDLIVRRFLSSFAPVALRERLRVEITSGSEVYSASGGRIVEKGWTEFYGEYYTTEDVELPKFDMGAHVKLVDTKKTKKDTKPPKRFTQTSLVSELEDRDLGTKSTRSVVVDTLFKRGYVDGKSLEVSDFGIKICDVLRKYAPEVLDENLTRKLEKETEAIQEGKVDKDAVIKEGKEMLIQILDKWKTHEREIGQELVTALKYTEQQASLVGPCDKCDKNLRVIHMRDGRQFIGCFGYPNCRNAYPLPFGAFVQTTDAKCKDCQKPMVNIKKGKTRYTMCIDPKCPSKLKWKKSGTDAENNKPSGQGETNIAKS
ncbi:DNA topoisomerase I [Candidatus Micrarchaeota archaeon]|nr:DNA topoisomerase I [Candidatus Micrarchaeota archaeon]